MAKVVQIIDYGASNIRSIINAVSFLGYESIVISNADEIDHNSLPLPLILPGVGRFDSAMNELETRGLKDWLVDSVTVRKAPILGICLGFQLIMESSAESPKVAGLGFVPSNVVSLRDCGWTGPIPRVGFDTITHDSDSILNCSLPLSYDVYFCHSFGVLSNLSFVKCRTGENRTIAATIEHQNVFGTQFHPEKSQHVGLHILQNFFKYSESII